MINIGIKIKQKREEKKKTIETYSYCIFLQFHQAIRIRIHTHELIGDNEATVDCCWSMKLPRKFVH